jgi:hypothetical protein
VLPDEYIQLIEKYYEVFGDGPPIFGMEEKEAIRKMRSAIEIGKPIKDTPDKHIPDGAIL